MAAHIWEKLPSIIIVEILSYLSLTDKLSASSTCQRWRSCLFHPSLWRSLKFQVKSGRRRSAKHLADMCGRFLRDAVVEFNSKTEVNVKECLRILNIFSHNANLQKLALQPSSCQVEWCERETRDVRELYIDALEKIVRNCRHLRHLSLGCIGELTDTADELLPLLAEHQADTLETLHIASIKEDPDSYGLIDLPIECFGAFRGLRVLGIDYDYLTNQFLDSFAHRHTGGGLEKLIIHVHGIEPGHENISNSTWLRVANRNPKLEVTLNLIHSIDGANAILDLLRPAMPLAHLRMFFCQHLPVAAIDFISQYMGSKLKSVHIIDGLIEGSPMMYDVDMLEDPFVILAWKCRNLQSLTLIGYAIGEDSVVGIARLRGQKLLTLDVPLCCIVTVSENEDEVWTVTGVAGSEFNREVSRSLGYDWQPTPDNRLHSAVKIPDADAETAYLKILLQEQTW